MYLNQRRSGSGAQTGTDAVQFTEEAQRAIGEIGQWRGLLVPSNPAGIDAGDRSIGIETPEHFFGGLALYHGEADRCAAARQRSADWR